MQPVARWLVFLLNFLLVLMALVQVAGRLVMPWLASLEDEINQFLARQQISVAGLEGDWLTLNPVIRIGSVRMPAGEINGLILQPDLLESAIRSDWVLRRASISGGHVALARTERGWWLAGMTPQGGLRLDLEDLLMQSDELTGQLKLTFLDDTPRTLNLDLKAINRGGRHAFALQASNDGCPDCRLDLRLDRTDRLPFLRPVIHDGYVVVRNFVIPAPLTGGASVTIGAVTGNWQHQEHEGRGRVEIEDVAVQVNGINPFTAAATLRAWSSNDVGGFRGDVVLESTDDALTVSNVDLHASRQHIELHVDRLDLEPISRFAAAVTAPNERISRWFYGLQARGVASDVRAFLTRDLEAEDPAWRFGYGTTVSGLHTRSFAGVPEMHEAEAEIIGHRRGFAASLLKPEFRIAFPETFAEAWATTGTRGSVQVWFRPGFSAILGKDLVATTLGVSTHGSFAIASPEALPRKMMSLLVWADRADMDAATTFVPRTLEPGLLAWLDSAPQSGVLEHIAFAYQGQLKSAGIEHARRVEIRTQLSDTVLVFHKDWPKLERLSGALALRGNDAEFLATGGETMGLDIIGSRVAVVNRARDVIVDLDTTADGSRMLDYLRRSPLQDRMAFVKPEWSMAGAVRLGGRVEVPLKAEDDDGGSRLVHAALSGALQGVKLDLPDLRLSLADLRGDFTFTTPSALAAEGLQGTLFGYPMTLDIQPGAEHLWFKAQGRLDHVRALAIANLDDPGFVLGELDYHADIGVAVRDGATTEIGLTSDLKGISLDLPGSLAKTVDELTPSTVGLQLLKDHSALAFQYRDLQGWLHLAGTPLRGAVGLGAPPPAIEVAEDVVRIGGRLHQFELEAWTRFFEVEKDQVAATVAPAFDRWQIDDFRIDRATIGDVSFSDLLVNGRPVGERLHFTLEGDELAGDVKFGASLPIDIDLELLRFPAAPPPEPVASMAPAHPVYGPHPDKDPLSESLIAELPEMNVSIKQILRGDEDYGRWAFRLRKPAPEVVQIDALMAEVKGLSIASTDGVSWTAADDMSAFKGTLTMGNLAEVLPQWRYAPTVASETAVLDANVRWSGSPLNIAITGLVGTIDLSARNGRFLEVESGSGAMRIMSLFSFAAILKRLNFNFSDVIGKGVSFETLDAGIELRDNILSFVRPMEVKSTSSDFRLGGKVNMATGALDNELVMTLPVSKNLPWYGVYIALANPLAGLGVLVGERMLRKPLEQFSSAKYAVRGTLAEPDVRFVELFDSKLSAVPAAPAVSPTDGEPGSASGAVADPLPAPVVSPVPTTGDEQG